MGELSGNVRGVETRGKWVERPNAVGSWWERSGNAVGMGRIPHFDLMESGWDQGGIAGGIYKTCFWHIYTCTACCSDESLCPAVLPDTTTPSTPRESQAHLILDSAKDL